MFKNIFKKNTVEKTSETELDIKLAIVIPDIEIKAGVVPVITDAENNFNEIIMSDGIRYRVKSETAKEVFRINYQLNSFILSDISKDKLEGVKVWTETYPFLCSQGLFSYVSKQEIQHIVARVFVTSSGGYFIQHLKKSADSSECKATYEALDIIELNKLISRCDEFRRSSENGTKVYFQDLTFSNPHIYAVKHGTYSTASEYVNAIGLVGYQDERPISSVEIVDQKLYDEIVKDY